MGNFLCILSGCILYGVCIIYENIPAFCRSGIFHFQNCTYGRCTVCHRCNVFCCEGFGQIISERKIFQRSEMAVCSTGRIYATGNLYGNLCEYRLTGTAGSSHDLVCMGLLSERRLDMEKLYTPCSGNGRMCIVLL